MSPLVSRWLGIGPDDLEQLDIMYCISEVVPALGASCETWAQPVFDRSIAMLQQQLMNRQSQATGGPEYEPALLSAALTMVSALSEALSASVENLTAKTQLLEMVLLACGDPDPAVRQGGFGLLGDLAKTCPSRVLPDMQRCLEACGTVLAAEQLDSVADVRAASNVCWAMGELIFRAPAQDLESRFALPLLQLLARVLSARTSTSKAMAENAAIALGRLAMRCPQVLAPHAPAFVENLCIALRRVRDGAEKEQAFAGLCEVVRINPMGALPAMVAMANAFASWHMLRDKDLHRRMSELLRGYKVRIYYTHSCHACRPLHAFYAGASSS